MNAKLIASALLITVGFSACNQAEVERLKTENDKLNSEVNSLKSESTLKDSTITDFFQAFNDIEENLKQIKEKENILMKSLDREFQPSLKDKIINDVQMMNELMIENKKRIISLSSSLKKANIKSEEFELMLVNMQGMLEDKDHDISELREALVNSNSALRALNDMYSETMLENEEQLAELNKAYYAFGSFKELEENKVLTKEGGIIGIGSTKKMRNDFNAEYFNEVDISTQEDIHFFSNKVKLITTHPSSSFELKLEKNAYVLYIKNKRAFWSSSKHLVVVTD